MTRPRRFDLIVFDWDGTLFDSTALITRCIQAACADLGTQVTVLEALPHGLYRVGIERQREEDRVHAKLLDDRRRLGRPADDRPDLLAMAQPERIPA